MQPPKAWLAAEGVIVDVDTLKKAMQMAVKQFVFQDKDYKPAKPLTLTMDMKVAVIYRDSIAIPLSSVQKGDDGTVVSYSETMKKLVAAPGESAEALTKRFPTAIPADELYLKRKDLATPKEKPPVPDIDKPIPLSTLLWTTAATIASILLLLALLPGIVLRYYLLRYRNALIAGSKPYWAFRAATYYLHMCGIWRGTLTPMQYARTLVDPQLGTSLTGFMNIYLKKKYANQPLTASEQEKVNTFLFSFLSAVRSRIKISTRFIGFINPVRCASFFVMPEQENTDQ
jgi:hypothetical protein